MRTQRYCLVLLYIFLSAISSIAQEQITLKEVAKLRLSETYSGFSASDYDLRKIKTFEVVREKGLWKSYQLIDSAKRKFIKEIPENELENLLKIIAAKDTSIQTVQFEIDNKEMASAFEELNNTYRLKHAELRPAQKTMFINALENRSRTNQYLRKRLKILSWENTAYAIAITTNSGIQKVITSGPRNTVYKLPWLINNEQIFNPNITRFFGVATGIKDFEKAIKADMYQTLSMDIYQREYLNSFGWENLKEDFPSIVRQMGSTLHNIKCEKSRDSWRAVFSSSILPEQVQLSAEFKEPDSILISMKQMENKVADLVKKSSFFFKHLQSRPSFKADFDVTTTEAANHHKLHFYDLLNTSYKRLLPYKAEEVICATIFHSVDKKPTGQWSDVYLLLPNKTMIVFPFGRYPEYEEKKIYVYNRKGDLVETLPAN